MRNKSVVTVMLMVMLLVVVMAPTVFAGTQQLYNNVQIKIGPVDNSYSPADTDNTDIEAPQCETSLNQEPVVAKNDQPAASEAQEPVVAKNDQPAASEAQEPVVAKNDQPAASEIQEPAVPEYEQPQQAEQPAVLDQNLSGLSQQEREMVQYVNQERAKAGLKPLQADIELTKVARMKSQDMVDNGYFAHNSPTYGSPFDMMKNFGIQYKTAGENIARNGSVMGAHQSLMNSEGHRANILNHNFTHIGIGIVNNGSMGGVTITQMFIAK